MLPLKYQDGWATGPRPHKRADVALLQAMFGLDYGSQQGFYGPSTAEDIGNALGTGPVNEFGYEEAQLAAAKGIFVGGTGGGPHDHDDRYYTKSQANSRYVNMGETIKVAKP